MRTPIGGFRRKMVEINKEENRKEKWESWQRKKVASRKKTGEGADIQLSRS